MFVLVVLLTAGFALTGQTISAAVRPLPDAARADEALLPVLLSGETVPAYLKTAALWEAANQLSSRYWTGRLERQAQQDAQAQALLTARREQNLRQDSPEWAALEYVRLAAASPQGPGQEAFRQARRYFTDAQITELSLAAAYMAWAARLSHALALEDPGGVLAVRPTPELSSARVSLPGPAVPKDLPLAVGILQLLPRHLPLVLRLRAAVEPAQRNRLPALAFFAAAQVNFASYTLPMAVAALRQSGLSTARIARLSDTDDGLTPAEKAALAFSRRLTVEPAAAAAAYRTLQAAVGDRPALEVLIAAAWSNFVQHLGDALHLPPDPAGLRTYREVFQTPLPQRDEGGLR